MSAKVTLARETHVYTDSKGRGVPLSVSQVLSLSGIVPPYPESARHFVERAGELGTTVHEWCDYLDSGETDLSSLEGDSVILPYLTAYQRFREKHNPVWTGVEQALWSETLGVAGTADRIGTIEVNGLAVPVIVDIKTPKSKQDYWQLQLSGYSVLAELPKHALYALWLAQDATFKLLPYQSDPETFLAAVKVAHWRLAHNGKVPA